MIDFSELVVRMVLTNGIENEDIKREVLGTDKVEILTLAETISLIETKECAARSLTSEDNITKETAAATSSYKKIAKTDPRLQATDKCKGCGEKFKANVIRSRKGRDDEIHTFKSCKNCYLSEKKKTSGKKEKPEDSSGGAEHGALEFGYLCSSEVYEVATVGPKKYRDKAVKFPNMVFDGNKGWHEENSGEHPRVTVEVNTEESDYAHLKLPFPTAKKTRLEAITDSGAQVNLLG